MKELKDMSIGELNNLQKEINLIRADKRRKSINGIPDNVVNKLKKDFNNLYEFMQKTWEIKVPIKYVYHVSIAVEDSCCYLEWVESHKDEIDYIDYNQMDNEEFCDRHPSIGKYIERAQKKFDAFSDRIAKLSAEFGVSKDDLWKIADERGLWA